MKPGSNNIFILFFSRISMFMTQLHDNHDQFCQYKSCDSYWPDDVSMTQYRSILSGFKPMRASVTLQKKDKRSYFTQMSGTLLEYPPVNSGSAMHCNIDMKPPLESSEWRREFLFTKYKKFSEYHWPLDRSGVYLQCHGVYTATPLQHTHNYAVYLPYKLLIHWRHCQQMVVYLQPTRQLHRSYTASTSVWAATPFACYEKVCTKFFLFSFQQNLLDVLWFRLHYDWSQGSDNWIVFFFGLSSFNLH